MGQRVIQLVEIDDGRMMDCKQAETKGENVEVILLLEYTGMYVWIWRRHGTPLQFFCLENPMDGGAWWAAVHGVTKSRTGLSDFTFPFHFHALEKEMATHSSVLARRIQGRGHTELDTTEAT